MLPDIDSLALFVRAAEFGSLTRAAEASNIGPAGASRRIMLLEARFKTPLFERSPKGMKLTQAGEWLLTHARTVLGQMNEMQLVMKDFATGRSGALRVLVNASAIAEGFIDDIGSFLRADKTIDLTIEERWSEEIASALRNAEADLGIVVEGTPMEGLESFTYRTDHLAALTLADHPLARSSEVRLTDLLETDVVTLEARSSIARLLSERASTSGQAFEPRFQVRNFTALHGMVENGMGAGVMPAEVASQLRLGVDVVVRPLAERWACRRMLVCVRAERTCNPVLSRLLGHLSSQPHDEMVDRKSEDLRSLPDHLQVVVGGS